MALLRRQLQPPSDASPLPGKEWMLVVDAGSIPKRGTELLCAPDSIFTDALTVLVVRFHVAEHNVISLMI